MSLYFQTKRNQNKKIKKSLPGSTMISASQKETPRYICFSGVFTLEAAVVLPLAACFFVSILFFFRVMQVQLEVQKALDDTGRMISVYYNKVPENGKFVDKAVVKGLFLKKLAERKVVKKYVKGGIAGISLSGSDLSGMEVNLEAAYEIRFPLRLLGLLNINMVQRTDCRKWTGWGADQEGVGGDVWVYVAETGKVYHLVENCTHLKLSVRQADIQAVFIMQNENGAKYQKCTLCAKKDSGQKQVYITRQGDRYHFNLKCRGLKRTIFRIRQSETGQLKVCSKCGVEVMR